MSNTQTHTAVLLTEAVASLAIKPAGLYVDATFGRGGHAQAILSQLNEKGQLLVIDKDRDAITHAKKQFQIDPRVIVCQGSFTHLTQWITANWPDQKVDGILFDLGVSSPQIDDPERGFSFMNDGPLDMRMDVTKGISAADWLRAASESDISRVLKEYAEERYAKRIASRIVEIREHTPITRTRQLAQLVEEAIPKAEQHKHPGTRTFQAIRIFINDELSDLEDALQQAICLLKKSGRLVVISFHSLEDRMTKHLIRDKARPRAVPRGLPIKTLNDMHICLREIGKPIKASTSEIAHNVRARSAVLRVAEKIV